MEENNKGLAKRSTTSGSMLSVINNAEDVERLVDYIANSKTYNKNFQINTEGEDGKIERVVDRNAIATCLMLGAELGFKPMESIMMGRRLDDKAVIKVYRGRDLGLSPMTALQNIYVWDSNGKETIYTSIGVINKCLTDAGVIKTIIDDGTKPYYYYVTADTGEAVDFDENTHVPLNAGWDLKRIEEGLLAKKIKVLQKSTRRGLVELKRKNETVAIPFTLVQAVEAGLYPGTNSFGEEVKGKDNWTKHPAAHLVKMSIMNGARLIIGDVLQGSIYIAEELPVNQVEDVHAETVD